MRFQCMCSVLSGGLGTRLYDRSESWYRGAHHGGKAVMCVLVGVCMLVGYPDRHAHLWECHFPDDVQPLLTCCTNPLTEVIRPVTDDRPLLSNHLEETMSQEDLELLLNLFSDDDES